MKKEIDKKKLIEIVESWKRVLDDGNHWNEAGWEDEQAYDQIVAILKNQPTITKRDIQSWADEAREQVTSHRDWEYIEDTMKEMLTDVGVSITVDPHVKSGKL